jgi:hypothetical protein
MYFPLNWELNSALSTLRNFGGFNPPRYATANHKTKRPQLIRHRHPWGISKVLHTALARPVGSCNLSDFRDRCEPDFSKEHCVGIRRLRGPCSAKRGLEMEEENDSGLISSSDQRSYIKN